jgi:hypothetical protein
VLSTTESNVTLIGVSMTNNTAVNAGAVSVQGELRCNDSSFSDNTAQSRGGAVVGDAQSGMLPYNTSFTNNTSLGKLSAIKVSSTSMCAQYTLCATVAAVHKHCKLYNMLQHTTAVCASVFTMCV